MNENEFNYNYKKLYLPRGTNPKETIYSQISHPSKTDRGVGSSVGVGYR